MGKAQSKRSVDITTDPKKDGVIEEGTGEMKKIEDIDQLKPQINGDTHHNENEEKDKVAETTGETENEKDLSTEKEQLTIDNKAQGEGGGDAATITTPVVTTSENGDELLDESKGGGATADTSTATSTAETPDSSKKPKKEKVKKKWSFRSISFGKKDKQKPSKKDDANTSAVNGECEKVPEETAEEPTAEKKDEATVAAATTDVATESNEIPAATESAAATVATTESPKEETVNTANAVTVEKPTEILVVGGTGDIEAAAAAVETVVTPITNGKVTPTADATTTVEEIAESLAAVQINDKIDENTAATIVPEIKKTEEETTTITTQPAVEEVITTNGDKHNDDDDIEIKTNGDVAATTATTTVETTTAEPVIVSSPKLNGSSESPKIEVKEDIIDTNTTKPVIVNNNISINENNVAQNDIDNKNIIEPSLSISSPQPPPPLPCSPPPSQVMVFALSDIKPTNDQNQQTEQHQQQQQNNDEKKDDSLNTVYEKLQTTIEEFIPIPESIVPEEILHKIENIKEVECKLPIKDQQDDTVQQLPEIQTNIKEDENLLQKISQNINVIEEIQIEQHTSQIPEQELTKTELLIPELISQINIIDNQTIDVIPSTTVVQEFEIAQHTSQIPEIELSKNEVIIPEINDIQLKQDETTTDNNTVTTTDENVELTLSLTDSQSIITNETDNDLPTPPPSPIQDILTINNSNNMDEIRKDINDFVGGVLGVGESASLDLDKMTGSSDVLLITTEQGVQVNDDDVNLQQIQQQQQNKQKQQQQQQQQHKKNKENGVAENHADTLATESLNGVEHKTIEEIKAENQQIEKIVSAEVTQESATVAE